jgi:hypothetical protein
VRQEIEMGLVFQRRLLAPQRISGSYRPFDYIFGIRKMQSKNRDAHPHGTVGQRAKLARFRIHFPMHPTARLASIKD